jgi:hypothetical protein
MYSIRHYFLNVELKELSHELLLVFGFPRQATKQHLEVGHSNCPYIAFYAVLYLF